MNPEIGRLCDWLLDALVNGTCQGVLVAALVWLGFKLIPNSNAATRHAICFGTLILVAILPPTHLLLSASHWQDPVAEPIASQASAALLTGHVESESEASVQPAPVFNEPIPASFEPSLVAADSPNQPLHDAPLPKPSAFYSAESTLPVAAPSTFATSLTQSAPTTASAPKPSTLQQVWHLCRSSRWAPNRSLILPRTAAFVLVLCWLGIASLRLGRLGWQTLSMLSLKRRSIFPAPSARAHLESVRREMGIERQADIVLCPSPAVPMAIGFLRPAVLLPSDIFQRATSDQVDQIVRHELAHLGRRDDWANLAQQAIHALLFFHPGVCWLSARLVMEREIACDDHVLAASRAPRAYAAFLVEFAGRTLGLSSPAAPAGWKNKSQLSERIHMILNGTRNTSPRLNRVRTGTFTAAAAVAALLALGTTPRLVFGQDQAPAAENEATAPAAPQAPADVVPPAPPEPDEPADEPALTTRIAPSGPRTKPLPAPAAGRTAPVIVTTASGAPPVAMVGSVSTAPATPPTVVLKTDKDRRSAGKTFAYGGGGGGYAVGGGSSGSGSGGYGEGYSAGYGKSVPAGERQGSIEERLERLERMMDKLMTREAGHAAAGGNFKSNGPQAVSALHADADLVRGSFKFNGPQAGTLQSGAARTFGDMPPADLRNVNEETAKAVKQAADAARQAQMAAVEAQHKAIAQMKEEQQAAAKAKAKAQAEAGVANASDRKEADAAHREALEAEMRALEERLAMLKQQLKQMDKSPETH